MKTKTIFPAIAIAASTLLTFSTAAFAVSQPVNISTNSELQSLQTAELSSQKVASWWDIFIGEAEDEEPETVNKCKPKQKDCGWS